MKYLKFLLALLLLVPQFSSCIENTVPYPTLEGLILNVTADGLLESKINKDNYSVVLNFAETENLSEIKNLKLSLNDKAKLRSEIPAEVDLSKPLKVSIETYPDQIYEWTITGAVSIAYAFRVEGQIGQADIDLVNHKVTVNVESATLLNSINVIEAKLGSSQSSASVDLLNVHDFSDAVLVDVTDNGKTITWTIRIYTLGSGTDVVFDANPWAKHAFLTATDANLNATHEFRYRKEGSEGWTVVKSGITVSGSEYSVRIDNLEPVTTYECMFVSGDVESRIKSFVTEDAQQVPNMNFDSWWQKKKIWYPNPENNEPFVWDSGNDGVTTVGGPSNTEPEYEKVVKGTACHMYSKTVFGVFAAGSVYTGQFLGKSGLNGTMNQGYPYTCRPTSFNGYYIYHPQTINKAKSPYADMKGSMDQGCIYAALLDIDEPHYLHSGKPETFMDVDNDPCVVALARVDVCATGDDYKEFHVDFKYRDLVRIPKYVLITISSSARGDYFTGGEDSEMYVDELSFGFE